MNDQIFAIRARIGRIPCRIPFLFLFLFPGATFCAFRRS